MSASEPRGRHILIVDDDPNLVMFLGDRLRRDGYQVSVAFDARSAVTQLETAWPDLVVMDLMEPGRNGDSVARYVKDRGDVPIVILSAVATNERKLAALTRYAEDYIVRPFEYAEFEIRLRRILQRVGTQPPREELVLGPALTIELGRRRAVVGGREVVISPIETRLLSALARAMGTSVSTDELLARVWNAREGTDPAYVWVTVRRLRQKIEMVPSDPAHLVSMPGGGYRLVMVDPSATAET